MTSGAQANSGRTFRSLLRWLLITLVIANIAVWIAWPLRDKLVEVDILMPPPVERVDLDIQALPPIPERVDAGPGVDRAAILRVEPPPESGESEDIDWATPPDADILSLLPTSGTNVEDPLSTAPSGSPALLDCVVAGPFDSSDTAESVAARFRSAGALVETLEESGAPPDYVVYVEPTASRVSARQIMLELRAQSIGQDAFVIASGPDENGVSVGYHSNRDLAVARRDQVAALGYAVKIRTRDGAAYRVRVRQVSADALAGLTHTPCVGEEP